MNENPFVPHNVYKPDETDCRSKWRFVPAVLCFLLGSTYLLFAIVLTADAINQSVKPIFGAYACFIVGVTGILASVAIGLEKFNIGISLLAVAFGVFAGAEYFASAEESTKSNIRRIIKENFGDQASGDELDYVRKC
jgi:hypothetical protein